MITYEKAIKLVLENVETLKTERVSVDESVGRVLTEDVYSSINMPPFVKSAMDGYAVIAEDVRKTPVKLKSIGVIQAGQAFSGKIKSGECMKIMTGAPLPGKADSVVMVEYTGQIGKTVNIEKSVMKRENVCEAGEDLKKGQKILSRGVKIGSAHIGVLAAAGNKYVMVRKKPRIAIINTGDEIVPLGNRLGKGKIYNSNGPMLTALLRADGIEPGFVTAVGDKYNELKKAVEKGLKLDLLLISGGVSMGDYDIVPDVLEKAGVRNIFHKVKMKPGKPVFFGKRNNSIVVGIPGNPVSNYVAYFVFIKPALNKMTGHKPYELEYEQGIIQSDFHKKPGRMNFVMVKIEKKDGQNFLNPVKSHGSADIYSLSKANGFMVVEGDISRVKKNSVMKYFALQNA